MSGGGAESKSRHFSIDDAFAVPLPIGVFNQNLHLSKNENKQKSMFSELVGQMLVVTSTIKQTIT